MKNYVYEIVGISERITVLVLYINNKKWRSSRLEKLESALSQHRKQTNIVMDDFNSKL